ncbi:MAG: DUF58 domain-containing protein [Thermoplasmata archaeon]
MLTRGGWAWIGAALGGLLLGVATLNLLPIALALVALGFGLAEVALFERSARRLGWATIRAERRVLTERLSAGESGATEVTITPSSALRPVYVTVEDSIPSLLEVVRGRERLATWWSGSAPITLAYAFRFRARGQYVIGPTVLVARDPLGFASRTLRLATEGSVAVSPAAPEVALRRSVLRLATRTLGATPVARRGYGTEFRSLREYQVGDDYRAIAWRRSRAGTVWVREFEQESRQDFLIAIDLAPEMAAGPVGATALDRACEAGMLLGRYVPRGGDRLGLATFRDGRTDRFVPPDRGDHHLMRITEALSTVTTAPGGASLAEVTTELARRLRQPTHVFLFAPAPPDLGLVPSLASFRRAGHRLYCFSPETADLPEDPSEPTGRPYLRLAREAQRELDDRRRKALTRQGIPVYPYDRRGAVVRLLALYQQIHAWGVGR